MSPKEEVEVSGAKGETGSLRIGQLAQVTGVSTKTIRFYEEMGVLPPARRAANGYRQLDFSLEQLHLGGRVLLISKDVLGYGISKKFIGMCKSVVRGMASTYVLHQMAECLISEMSSQTSHLTRLFI